MSVLFPQYSSSPFFTINGVPTTIWLGESGEEGGIVEQWGDKGLEVTVYFQCAWLNRIDLLRGLRGTVSYSGGSISRQPPFNLPPNPERPDIAWQNYICTGTGPIAGKKFRTDQDGSITGLAGWGYYAAAVIPAQFEVTSYQVIGNSPTTQNDPSGLPYTTTKLKSSGEVFCPPTGAYTWVNTMNQAPVEDVFAGITRGRTEISITRHFMPVIPLVQIQTIIGGVNGKPLTLANYTYPKGTVLAIGTAESDPYGDPSTGLLVQDITYSLLANAPSNLPTSGADLTLQWNVFMNPQGVYDQIQDSNQNPPFQSVNLNSAIWPEYFKPGT